MVSDSSSVFLNFNTHGVGADREMNFSERVAERPQSDILQFRAVEISGGVVSPAFLFSENEGA
jgi:hypothetical protein